MNKNQIKKTFQAFALILILAAIMLQGCGGKGQKSTEDLLADMKEFSLPNGTASLYLNNSWEAEDMGLDTFMTVGNAIGTDAVLLFQFPKGGIYQVESIEDLKDFIETSYQIDEEQAVEDMEIPNMSNIEAMTCKVTSQGITGQACIVTGETDYAFYSIGYVGLKMSDAKMASFKASCSTFQEEAPEIEESATAEVTDTIRWFNATYAILTEINGWDYTYFGGMPANHDSMVLNQQMLDQWWGVTDRASADDTLDWILTKGHRADYAQTYGEEREHEIAGWDYCRAMNLMGYYYLAGYYTEEEALDKSLEIAQIMQPLFDSWDDLIDSYLLGYEYWAEESSSERRSVYEDLKTREDNPYQVDYHLTLEKTW